MTTSQWQVALEGKYVFIETSHLGACAPRTPEDILRKLPISGDFAVSHHHASKQQRLTSIADASLSDRIARSVPHGTHDGLSAEQRRKQRQICDRADINARFALQGGFAPYRSDMCPLFSSVRRNQEITLAIAEQDKNLWSELVWEISVVSFRMEFCGLDVVLLPDLYQNPLRHAQASERMAQITLIWGDEFELQLGAGDKLISCDSSVRWEAVRRMARVMSSWPGGFAQTWEVDLERLQNGSWHQVERSIYLFYITLYHSRYSRIPTVPFLAPKHLV